MSRLEIPSGMTWSLAKRKQRKWKSGFPKITFPADKERGPGLGVGRAELEVVCKWERGLKSATHIHAHIAMHRWKIKLEEPEILYQLLNILLLIVKKTLMAQTQSDIT